MKDIVARTPTFSVLASRLAVKLLFAALLFAAPLAVLAQTLGTAANFTALGGTTITCATSPTIVGDMGVNLGGSISACAPTGTLHVGDAIAQTAYSDFLAAYTSYSPQPADVFTSVSGTLAGAVLPPGMYCFDSSAALTGVLTLNGPPDGVWIFKIGRVDPAATLAATSFTIAMPGGQPCQNNVFWWTPTSATLTSSTFIGTILAGTSFTLTGGSLDGRALAKTSITITGPASMCSCATIALAPATLPPGTVGTLYSQTIVASGGPAPYTYAVTGGALPAGLTLNATTGLLSGTPSASGTSNFTVTATGPAGCTGSRAYILIINPPACPPITVGPATLTTGTVGVAYSQALFATGGAAPYTFAVATGILPAGLTLALDGVLSGTPSAPGTFSFMVTATDSLGCRGSRDYVLVINPPICETITLWPSPLPTGTVGVDYLQVFGATGGVEPYTFALASGVLPPGLMLSPHGFIAGTPTLAGTYAFTMVATGDHGCTGSQLYALVINPAACPVIVVGPATLLSGTVGTAYSQALWATGGAAPYTFAVAAGGLPLGLTLSSGGVLSGIPTAAGTSNFMVTATDTLGCTGSQQYAFIINPAACPTILLAPSPLPNGMVGVAYSQLISATGGTAPYTFAVASGSLPVGLTLSSGGLLSGTPTLAGTSAFTLIATDTHGCTGSQLYALLINPVACGTITISPSPLPTGTVGAAYLQVFGATGGVEPYTFAMASGVLPPGLMLTPHGVLAGTPTLAGTYGFTMVATSDHGCTGSQIYALVINPAACPIIVVGPATLLPGTVGAVYSQALWATGGAGPYTFHLASGSLPVGLTLSSGGVLSSTPTIAGTSSFTVTATDTLGCTGSQLYAAVINPAACPTILLAPAPLPSGTVGTTYSQVISATGGTAPYTFAVASGSLPIGLTLSSGGLLSGTPTTAGTSTFTLIATDSHGCTGSLLYALIINPAVCGTITISPSPLPSGTVGVAYLQIFGATGGVEPYTFALASGVLPPGLLLTPHGVLSGTPTASGTYGFTMIATGDHGCTGSQICALVINPPACPTIVVAPATLPNGTVGVAYSQTFSATGGTAPYTFALASGSLPVGLTLSSGGVLSGTPTVAGSSSFTITATDTNGCTGSHLYAAIINPPACPTIVVAPATLPNGTVGVAYSQTLSATGGTAPYTFALASGSLPVGLTLSSGGVLSGIPTTVGTFSFTLIATDTHACAGSRAYSLPVIVCPAIALSPASLPVGTVGLAYSQTITASGGTGRYTFAVTLGNLPPGLTLSSGGVLSGTPTTAGIFNFSVTATDANGCAGTRIYIGTMVNPPVILHMNATVPCTPFKIFVKGSNLQSGIIVYIDGVQWYAVTWKNTGKIVLKGGVFSAVHQGYHTFTFVNPDGGVATRTWRYLPPLKACGP